MSYAARNASRTARAYRAKKTDLALAALADAALADAALADNASRQPPGAQKFRVNGRWLAVPSQKSIEEMAMNSSSYAFMYDGGDYGVVLSDSAHSIAAWEAGRPYYVTSEMYQHDAPYTGQPGLVKAKKFFARLALAAAPRMDGR